MEDKINRPIEQTAEQPTRTTAKNTSRKLAIFLIAAPIVGLALILIAWSLLAFVLSAWATNGPPSLLLIIRIANIALGALGIVCVLGIMFAIPVGIILLLTRETKKEAK